MKRNGNSTSSISKQYIDSPWSVEDVDDVRPPDDDIRHGFLDLHPEAGGKRLALFAPVSPELHPTGWLRYDVSYDHIKFLRVVGGYVEIFTTCLSEICICSPVPARIADLLRTRRLRRVIGSSGYPICELGEVQAYGIDVHRHGEQEYQERQQWVVHLDSIYGKRTGLLSGERLN